MYLLCRGEMRCARSPGLSLRCAKVCERASGRVSRAWMRPARVSPPYQRNVDDDIKWCNSTDLLAPREDLEYRMHMARFERK